VGLGFRLILISFSQERRKNMKKRKIEKLKILLCDGNPGRNQAVYRD